jgi:hypothetical protein
MVLSRTVYFSLLLCGGIVGRREHGDLEEVITARARTRMIVCEGKTIQWQPQEGVATSEGSCKNSGTSH